MLYNLCICFYIIKRIEIANTHENIPKHLTIHAAQITPQKNAPRKHIPGIHRRKFDHTLLLTIIRFQIKLIRKKQRKTGIIHRSIKLRIFHPYRYISILHVSKSNY